MVFLPARVASWRYQRGLRSLTDTLSLSQLSRDQAKASAPTPGDHPTDEDDVNHLYINWTHLRGDLCTAVGSSRGGGGGDGNPAVWSEGLAICGQVVCCQRDWESHRKIASEPS